MARRKFRRLRRYSPRKRFRSFRRGKAPISLLTAIPMAHKTFIEPIFGDGAGRWGAAKMYETTNNLGDAALEAAEILVTNFTGFKIKGPDAGKFFPQHLITTYGEIVAGAIGSKIATKLGVNRQFKKMPMIGKYAKL